MRRSLLSICLVAASTLVSGCGASPSMDPDDYPRCQTGQDRTIYSITANERYAVGPIVGEDLVGLEVTFGDNGGMSASYYPQGSDDRRIVEDRFYTSDEPDPDHPVDWEVLIICSEVPENVSY